MSLLKFMKKGVELIGLSSEMLDAGGVVGENFGEVSKHILRGSYDVHKQLFGNTKITFHSDRTGKYPIVILPYYAGAINCCPVNGEEVISGPFTGCYFTLYLDWGGTLCCAHVDTAKNGNNSKPSEETWRKLDRNIIVERKTTVDDDLFKVMQKRHMSANEGFVLGVASPNPPMIELFNVTKRGDVLKVENKCKL